MRGGAEVEAPSFVYETLAPLTTRPDSPSPDLATAASYLVLRTQISATTAPSSQLAAPDFFSLDSPTCSPPPQPRLSPPSFDDSPPLQQAWFCSNRDFKSPMLKLHKEILDFCEFVSPTLEEQSFRAAAVQRVFGVVKYIWPHCRVEVFGSFKTGLYLPTSDIDVVILQSNMRSPQMCLQAVAKALSQKGIGKKIQVIGKARVPIVKFVEKQSGVAFDISFDLENGPKAAEFIKDAVAKIPPLRPLCLILKVFLQQRELNEVYTGGIGSYALLTMLIAHLKLNWRGQDFRGSQGSIEHNLGILLVNFFDFYGRKLNTYDVGISSKSSGTLFLKSVKGFQRAERPYLLSIEDPQAPDNDIGKNSFNFFQIRSAFAMAYSLLTDAKTIMSLGSNRSILGIIIRPDSVLLRRKGGRNGELTFNSLLPGAGQPVEQQVGDDHEIQCNWHLYDDEPLPRGNAQPEENSPESSRKRKASKLKQRTEKMENGMTPRYENGLNEDVGFKQWWKRREFHGRRSWPAWHRQH